MSFKIEHDVNNKSISFSDPRKGSGTVSKLLQKGMIVRDLSGYGMNAIKMGIVRKKV